MVIEPTRYMYFAINTSKHTQFCLALKKGLYETAVINETFDI